MADWENNVPAPESPAKRHERDVKAQQGDWQGTNGNLNRLDPGAKLTYVANGRVNRKYDQRGGDIYGTEDGNWHLEVDGRNAREYVNYDTHVAAHNSNESEVWDSPEVHKD